MILDGYVRVSQVAGRSGPSFISPDVQRESIARWAEYAGHNIGAWHEDLDRSGGTMTRPAFDAMMARVRSGESGGVVVAKIDRFGRTLVGALDALAEIDAAGAAFVSVAEQFDTATPTGKLVMRMMLTLAEFERDRITEGWAGAQERAIGRGVHMGNPFGYDRSPDGCLVPNADAEIVRAAFERRAAGMSFGMLADWLTSVAPTRDAPRWAESTVTKMLANRVYLGEATHGAYHNPSAHGAVVEPTLFHSANRSKTSVEKNTRWLLSGFLRCAGCRYAMRINVGGTAPMYVCRKSHSGGVCQSPASILVSMAEPHVLGLVFARHAITLGASLATADLTDARAAVEAAEEELRQFVRLTATSQYPELMAEGLREREGAVGTARLTLSRLEATLGDDALPGVFTLEDMWADWGVEHRRRALRAMFDCAFVFKVPRGSSVDGRVHMCWPGEAPVDLPRRGRGKVAPLRPFERVESPTRV